METVQSEYNNRPTKRFSNGIKGSAAVIVSLHGFPDCLPPSVPAIMFLALWYNHDQVYETNLSMRTLSMLQASIKHNWSRADGVSKNWTRQENLRKGRNACSKIIIS